MLERFCRFRFDTDVPMTDVEAALLLAVHAVENVHGQRPVRHRLDYGKRTCLLAVTSDAGRDLCDIFIRLLSRDVGEPAFVIEQFTRHSKRSRNRRTAIA